MASSYSSNLKLELIATGDQSGTWGDTTNTNFGTALEQAIVGQATATFASDADLTLTLTNSNAAQTARAFVLTVTSGVSLTVTRNLIVPTITKPYIVRNSTTGGQSIVVKTATGTGVTIANGASAMVYVDGANVIKGFGYQDSLVSGTNIKTINGTSVLGSGDVAVQPTLVSGTNIKTINGTSVLGSGNITISSGTGDVVGPASAVSGRIATFNGTTGKLIQDGGKLASDVVTGPAGASFGWLAMFTDSTGKAVYGDGALTSTTVVTLTGAQTLTNKTLTTPVLSGTASGTTAGRLGYASGVLTYGDGTSQFEIGFRNIPQNSQSAAYTLVLADSGKHILHPSADTTARTFTIPANSSVAFPVGTAITFVNQNGAGAITIAITTDTMRLAGAGTTGSRTLAANGVATAVKVTSTEWIISGTGLT